MKGIDEYTQKTYNRIDNLLEQNKDRKYLKGFVNHLLQTKSENTTYRYLEHVINFIDSTNKKINDFEYDDYIQYENSFIECTSSYRIVKHSSLKAFSEYLFISGICQTNPMEHSKSPKASQSVKTIEKREKSYLTPEEVKVYMSRIEVGVGSHRAKERQKQWKTRDKAIITMLINTGMRCSALYKLDLSDIDFDNRELHVKEKGKARLYVLNNNVTNALKEWIIVRESILNGKKEEALFISNQLTRMSQQSISNVTQKYGNALKDINITPHKLRATFGTQLQAMTGDIYLTKEAMGHSNIATTELYVRGQERVSQQKASDAMQILFA